MDRSFLSGLAESEQVALFRELALYSTFIWVRAEGGGLLLADPELHDVMRHARCQCSEPTSYQLSVQQVGDLGERELAYVRRDRDVLRTNRTARFVPGELSENERMVLLAAARQYALESNLEPDVAVDSLQTRFIQAGRSEAKIAVVRVNAQRMPVVAKIAPKLHVLQEMERFHTFIRRWDNELAPRVFLHGDCGVIFFGLVRGEADSTDPAPHLERRLEDFWIGEVFPREGLDPTEEDNLVAGLENAAAILCNLNSGKCEHAGFGSLSNPDLGHIRRLEGRRVRWDFEEVAFVARDLALERFKGLAEVAMVHGDVNLRNILVRGARDAHLIDYAGCGPGHPAIDLARLELSLYLRCFKQKQDESRCCEFPDSTGLQVWGF